MFNFFKPTAQAAQSPEVIAECAARKRVKGLIALTHDEVAALRLFNNQCMLLVHPGRFEPTTARAFLLENVLFRTLGEQWYFAGLQVRWADEMPLPPARIIAPFCVLDYSDLTAWLRQRRREYVGVTAIEQYKPVAA